MSLHVRDYGQGMPLVLFHGFGFDGNIWQSWVTKLALHYHLYLVDLPGFGDSDWMEWLEFKTQLLHQLPEKFAVVGWSMGGLYAMRLAVEAQSQITHVINIASLPRFIAAEAWPAVVQENFEFFHQQLVANPEATINEFIKLHAPNISYTPKKSQLKGLEKGLEVLLTWDLRSDIVKLTIPIVYIFGSRDAIVPRRMMKIMQKSYPSFAYALISDSAHAPFLSHKAQVLSVLEEVIGGRIVNTP